DFVLPHDEVVARVHNPVVGHEEIAQETEGFFAGFLERLRDLLPLCLELSELILPYMREQEVLEKVHRVETHAAFVDGLEGLQRVADIRGDVNEDDAVCEIAPIFLESLELLVVLLQISIDGVVGVEKISERAEAGNAGG